MNIRYLGQFNKFEYWVPFWSYQLNRLKGLWRTETFNARNYDAGISTPGLRGMAFDAGAFDAWKIDAGWFLTHRTTTQGDFWRTNLRGDFWRTNLGGDFWRTNLGGDFWRTNLRGWFLTHQFKGVIFDAPILGVIFDAFLACQMTQIDFSSTF